MRALVWRRRPGRHERARSRAWGVVLEAPPRLDLATGPDVWVWALWALQAAARADGIGAANEEIRGLLGRLTEESVQNLCLALAVVPRFGVGSHMLSSPAVLEEFQLQMAWVWSP